LLLFVFFDFWMSEIYAVDAVQYRMAQTIKNTVKKLKREKLGGLEEIRRNHYLQGSFSQLCKPQMLQEILFPGFSKEVLNTLPKNLVELVEWEELSTVLDYNVIAKNGAEVLSNIKKKGAKQGDYMDENTENVLLPQIAQEAFAKKVIEEVQKLNRKINNFVTKVVRQIASIEDERAKKEQLDEEIVLQYQTIGFAIQSEFLGNDWIPIIQRDLLRFFRDEKLSTVDSAGFAVIPSLSSSSSSSSSLSCNAIRIAWIENDDYLREMYPALSEVIEQLHALPYELNGKNPLFLYITIIIIMIVYIYIYILYNSSMSNQRISISRTSERMYSLSSISKRINTTITI
jgi:hypothetical protein